MYRSKTGYLPTHGLTLMELIVVMAILVVLMGMSAAVYISMSKSFKEQGAAGDLDVLLRQARNNAISNNAPAFVEIDVAGRVVTPWVYKTVGQWHFEKADGYGRSNGAFHNAKLQGAIIHKEGKIGGCVRLGESSCVDLGDSSDYDCDDGGCLEAYVKPEPIELGGSGYIFYKEGCYGLKINLKGELEGDAGAKTLRTNNPEYRIAPRRWTKVGFAWDRHSTRILIDDAVVAIGPGSEPDVKNYPLYVGHPTGNFVGFVDEVRVMTASKGRVLELPGIFTIQHTAAPWNAIYFAGDGTLDIRHHPGPVSVSLLGPKTIRTVTVSTLGLTTREEVESKPPPQPEEAKK
jgi:prepilin-type N-terminal cleavage/methylation domain-containing protein